ASDTGFAAFPVADPAIIGDLNGLNGVTATDGALLNFFLAGASQPQVPPYPGAPSNNPAGADPTVSIPKDLSAGARGTVTVPVNMDDPRPEGSTGLTQAHLALTYDPAVLSVSPADIRLGTVPASGTGWRLQTAVNAVTGQIGITLFSVTPIAVSAPGSLVTIDFHVLDGAAARATPINLVGAVNADGRRLVVRALDDSMGQLLLHPLPTDDATEAIDGLVTVIGDSTAVIDTDAVVADSMAQTPAAAALAAATDAVAADSVAQTPT